MERFVEDTVMEKPVNDSALFKFLTSHRNPQSTPTHLPAQCFSEEASKHVEALKALIFSEPVINEAKIQFLKEELAADRYAINSQRIANELVRYFK